MHSCFSNYFVDKIQFSLFGHFQQVAEDDNFLRWQSLTVWHEFLLNIKAIKLHVTQQVRSPIEQNSELSQHSDVS